MTARNVVVPLGGRHRSVASLLAEMMNDGSLARCVVFAIDGEGDWRLAQYDMSRAEMCFAAARIERFAFEE